VGYIKEAHGIRGEVLAPIPSQEWPWAQSDVIMTLIERGSNEISHELTIEKFRSHKKALLIKFKEVKDRNQAELLKGHGLYLPKDHFVAPAGDPPFLRELLGFEVFEKGTFIGRVVGFMDNGAQDLLRVKDESGRGEHLIPFLNVFVTSVDYELGRIETDLPEGLIE